MTKVALSLLAGNFVDMKSSVRQAERVGPDYLHCDVMDGMFVPNISFGFQMIRAVDEITDIPLDVHLMVMEPERYVERFAEAGADMITVHVEATLHVQRTLEMIRACGVQAGLALNPATPLSFVEYVLDDLDMILLMTVNPGYGGQRFIPSMLGKIADLHRMLQEHDSPVDIEIDGGLSSRNADAAARAGASVIVAGSAFFEARDQQAEFDAIRAAGGPAG